MLDNLRRSKTLRGLLAATAGFLLYGGWAFFINYEHGLDAGIKAGFTQGSYSFTLTLIMAFFMEWVFGLSDNPKRQFSQTFFTTCLMIYSTSWNTGNFSNYPARCHFQHFLYPFLHLGIIQTTAKLNDYPALTAPHHHSRQVVVSRFPRTDESVAHTVPALNHGHNHTSALSNIFSYSRAAASL